MQAARVRLLLFFCACGALIGPMLPTRRRGNQDHTFRTAPEFCSGPLRLTEIKNPRFRLKYPQGFIAGFLAVTQFEDLRTTRESPGTGEPDFGSARSR